MKISEFRSIINDKEAMRLTFHVPFNYFYSTHKNQFDMKHQIDFQVGIRTDFTRKHAYYISSDFIKCKPSPAQPQSKIVVDPLRGFNITICVLCRSEIEILSKMRLSLGGVLDGKKTRLKMKGQSTQAENILPALIVLSFFHPIVLAKFLIRIEVVSDYDFSI